MTPEQSAALRAPFPESAIGKIPKGGTWLDYVGHAAVTDRLLAVDPEWGWGCPRGEDGTPVITQRGNDSVLWISLRVCGVTRFGVGIVATKSFELEKQLISDAIRNAAMRFGVALDLWSKEDLHASNESSEVGGRGSGDAGPPQRPSVADASTAPSEHSQKNRRASLKARCVALTADGVSVADERETRGLPIVDSCDDLQLQAFETMVSELETELLKPFDRPHAANCHCNKCINAPAGLPSEEVVYA